MALGPSVSRRALLAALLATSTKSSNAQNTAQPFALPDIPGPLRPLGGLVIAPEALGGGGFSGAHLAPDLTLTLISDRGHWAEARLLLDGLTPVGLAPLRHAVSPPMLRHWRAGLMAPGWSLLNAATASALTASWMDRAFMSRHRRG
jgi:hypothetical protein